MSPSSEREATGEVTRVQAVAYLQGMTGHAIVSLLSLLLGAVGYWVTGGVLFAFGGLAGGFLLTANGFSIHLWDLVQEYVLSQQTADPDGDSDRTLSPQSMSNEHKAELTAGFVQILGIVASVSLALGMVQWFGVERGLYLLGGLLVVSDVGALVIGRLWR